jgi:anti-anti-sigma factor
MAVERRLTIPGVLERIAEACDFVVQAAEAAQLDDRAVYYCQMAVDEWCTNIVEHSYSNQDKQQHIEIVCESKPRYLSITIIDEGSQFDPRILPLDEPSKLLEEREPGGLGWYFIRKVMDDVHYEYKHGRNQLTMVKRSSGQPTEAATPVESTYTVEELDRHDVRVIRPTGRLDSTNGRILEATLNNQFDTGQLNLVVDMSGVNYISSGGLKVLIAAWRKAQKLHGMLLLSGMLPKVRKVFEISGFDSLFTITASVQDALSRIDNTTTGN